MKSYLNLGCGARFHPEWTNVDITSSGPHVLAHDLRRGIPFPDAAFEVVYHSHLLEHFSRRAGEDFMRECWRVLKPGGLIRVAVPDLEGIVRAYLQTLDEVLADQPDAPHRYAWMVLELYDQTVRERPGGLMLDYLRQNPIPEEAFVYARVGGEARRMVQVLRSAPAPRQLPSRWSVLRQRIADSARYRLTRAVIGDEGLRAMQIGRFRLGGELHQWMYDRYSLAQMLEAAGFAHPVRRTARESAIPNWAQFHLDTEPNGTVYKPDSLYMEAVKPAR